MLKIGKRVKRIRKRLGKTQVEFAKMLGVKNPVSVSRWENDEARPRLETWDKILRLEKKKIAA